MQKDILENFQKISQLTLENFKKLGETNLLIGQKLLQEQVKLTNSIFETAAQNADIAADAKDFKYAAAKQAELAQELSKKVADSSIVCADIIAEAGKIYTNLFEAGLKAASNAAEKTGGKTSKAA
ncbi:MAG: phasin family protein [Alphaproteobacteria bacterium]|nr:phasin family protein [Alphaproteobacteria bacterium]